jgi:hypothetical protein
MFQPFNPREVMAAAPDALALAMGATVNRPHPLAEELSLKEIAYAAGAVVRPDLVGVAYGSVVGAGLATGDFSKALAAAVKMVIVNTFVMQDQHSKFCTKIEAKSFLPQPLPSLDADIGLEPLAEGAEISRSASIVSAGATAAQLTTFAKILGLSRTAIYNDDMEAFTRVASGLGASAARLESMMVAQALESNPVLDDGRAVFDPANNVFQNIVTGAISGAAIGEAMAMLRMQLTASGARAELAAKHLVVSANLEHTARLITADLGKDIEISALSYLPTGRWYLLANPLIHPVVGILKLKGSKDAVKVTEQRDRPIECDGSAIKVVADLGAVLMSRTGIVRGNPA